MESENKKLTINEALEQGYSLCGWSEKEWQSLINIEDLSEDDFEYGSGVMVVASKQENVFTIDSETLNEIVADYIYDNYTQECADDTDEIYDLVKEIDFTEIVNTINEKISIKKWWTLTNIELIPNQ